MAAPVAAAAGKVAAWIGKKLATDILTDPSVIFKYMLIFAGIIFGLALLIILPMFFIISVPSVLFNGTSNVPAENAIFQNNVKLVAIYQKMPTKIESEIDKWAEEQRKAYEGKETEWHIEKKLEWQAVISLDAIKYRQDFSRVTEDEIIESARKFVYKEVHTYTYTTTSTDSDGNTTTVVHTVYVFTVKIKSLDEMMTEENYDEQEKLTCQAMYDFTKYFNIEQQQNIYDASTVIDPSSLKEYPAGNANIIYYSQVDKRWGLEPYGLSGNILTSGCGPTSLAMVVASLTGRSDITPKEVAQWSVTNGHRCEGAGSYWSLMTDGGAHYGLSVTAVSRRDYKTILNALSQGNPVIVAMGPGHFTKGGHFIVLRGLTADKKILVNDPASVERTNTAWGPDIIFNESSMAGGYNGSPFWIFKKN